MTHLLHAWRSGDRGALDELMAHIHGQLRQVARRAMRGERTGHTWQPTALVHEAFLRLVDAEVPWQDRVHFFAVAAGLMRRLLVDHARAADRDKRGGGQVRLELRDDDAVTAGPDVDLIALGDALDELERRKPEQARLVELRYFAGLTYPEIAEVIGVSRATVGRELRFVRSWLKRRLRATEP